jgi:hypothetical protein
MPKQYFIRKRSNGYIECALFVEWYRYSDFKSALKDYRFYNKGVKYIEIPESCARVAYGIDNMPKTQAGLKWPLPWYQ